MISTLAQLIRLIAIYRGDGVVVTFVYRAPLIEPNGTTIESSHRPA